MKYPTLYKRSKTGAILQWSIETNGAEYFATHGQVGGKLQVDVPTVATPRNEGRSNEKTAEEQAMFEASNRWKARVEHQAYVEDISQIDNVEVTDCGYFKPTLAHAQYESRFLPETVLVSPKLDGLRATISKDGSITRNGKPYVTTKFIEEALKPLFEAYPDLVLDGELYNHELKDDFNEIASLARKTKASSIKPAGWKKIEQILQFHIFDAKFEDSPEMTYQERHDFLKIISEGMFLNHSKIKLVEQVWCMNNEEDIREKHDYYVSLGYEGAMARDPFDIYHHQRVNTLQKIKMFIAEEFPIVDFEPGRGKMVNKAARVIVLLKNNNTSRPAINATHAQCEEYLKNKHKYIGKMATIKFQNYTPDGNLRFAKMIDIDRPDL